MSDTPLIDPSVLDALSEYGPPDFVERLIEIFLESANGTLHDIRNSAEEGNFAKVAFDAHNLRSGSGTLGLVALSEKAGEIEHFGSTDHASMRARVAELEGVFQSTLVELVEVRDRLREMSRIQ